jgi:tripartite-type tricarboxylate transporter receptor subunit TctC
MTSLHRLNRRTAVLGAAAALALPALPSLAQAFPNKPVRLIVPFPPAGAVDTVARVVGQKLAEQWGQQVVVDNRAGAGGMIGADAAAKSAPDGYTVLVCSIHHAVLPSMRPKMPYSIEKDLVPLSFGARFPIVLVVHPSVPANSVKELIALAKKSPGKLAFGSAGNGGGTHLAGELFNLQAGVELTHVPYKGSAPAVSDLLGGQIQLMFSDAPSVMQHIKAGKLRALGVANAQPSELLPGVPTIAEAGVPGFEAYSWAGFVAPAGTPKDIGKALALPEVKQRLLEAGAEARPTTSDEFGRILNAEITKWGKVVKAANIQPD